ncbi:MAG TPA: hypothetical protein VMF66_02230 [Candidatus Acidoferrum sp.]|nr:hypothetical protein [Candidatus Acidoferrum sp.]
MSDVSEDFEVDEPEDFVFRSEATNKFFAMFNDPAVQIVCHACIKVSGTAGENVDAIGPVRHGNANPTEDMEWNQPNLGKDN